MIFSDFAKSLLPHQWHGEHKSRWGGAEPIFQGPCFHVIGPGKVGRHLSQLWRERRATQLRRLTVSGDMKKDEQIWTNMIHIWCNIRYISNLNQNQNISKLLLITEPGQEITSGFDIRTRWRSIFFDGARCGRVSWLELNAVSTAGLGKAIFWGNFGPPWWQIVSAEHFTWWCPRPYQQCAKGANRTKGALDTLPRESLERLKKRIWVEYGTMYHDVSWPSKFFLQPTGPTLFQCGHEYRHSRVVHIVVGEHHCLWGMFWSDMVQWLGVFTCHTRKSMAIFRRVQIHPVSSVPAWDTCHHGVIHHVHPTVHNFSECSEPWKSWHLWEHGNIRHLIHHVHPTYTLTDG